jgi:hypothetical protein
VHRRDQHVAGDPTVLDTVGERALAAAGRPARGTQDLHALFTPSHEAPLSVARVLCTSNDGITIASN